MQYNAIKNYLPYFLSAAVTSFIIRTPAQFIHFLWLLLLGSLMVSGFGMLQAILDRPDWIFPKVIFDSYPNIVIIMHGVPIVKKFGCG